MKRQLLIVFVLLCVLFFGSGCSTVLYCSCQVQGGEARKQTSQLPFGNIARGDMGVEIGFEKVPAVQKRIIRRCRERGKAVIIATQLIDSMTENKTPTRAEVSDIANAVFDGATDLMVTGETAKGRYPVQVVREMAKIIEQAERDAEKYGQEIL